MASYQIELLWEWITRESGLENDLVSGQQDPETPVEVLSKTPFAKRNLESHAPAHAGADVVERGSAELLERRGARRTRIDPADPLFPGSACGGDPAFEPVPDEGIGVGARRLPAVGTRHLRIGKAVHEALHPSIIRRSGVLRGQHHDLSRRFPDASVPGQPVIELAVRNLDQSDKGLPSQVFGRSVGGT